VTVSILAREKKHSLKASQGDFAADKCLHYSLTWHMIVANRISDPLSAVITAEFASTKYRGGIIAAVFAMQGLGQLAASLVTLVVVVAYKDHLIHIKSVADCSGQCASTVDKMWRIIIAFGGIPGWFALYYRLTIPETPRYTFDVLYDVEKASVDARKYRYGKQGNVVNPVTQAQTRRDMAKYRTPRPTIMEVLRFYSQRKQAIRLFGTSMSWLYVPSSL
jgi:PHS family inorganic phosphate transporter-like MFS transporter